MNRLIIFLSSLGAVFLLALVAIGVLESVAFHWFKEALGPFPSDSGRDVTGRRQVSRHAHTERRNT